MHHEDRAQKQSARTESKRCLPIFSTVHPTLPPAQPSKPLRGCAHQPHAPTTTLPPTPQPTRDRLCAPRLRALERPVRDGRAVDGGVDAGGADRVRLQLVRVGDEVRGLALHAVRQRHLRNVVVQELRRVALRDARGERAQQARVHAHRRQRHTLPRGQRVVQVVLRAPHLQPRARRRVHRVEHHLPPRRGLVRQLRTTGGEERARVGTCGAGGDGVPCRPRAGDPSRHHNTTNT